MIQPKVFPAWQKHVSPHKPNSITNFMSNSIGEGIAWFIGIVLTFSSVLVFLYLEFRPRVKNVLSMSYIDFKGPKLIDTREFEVSWGWNIFGTKIKLPRIARKSKYELSCKPLASSMESLPSECYEEISKEKYSEVCLTRKRYFRDKEITKIRFETSTVIGRGFKKKISCKKSKNTIEITNRNPEEIKNYPVILPARITLDKLKPIFNQISSFKTSRTRSRGIKIFVDIPSKSGDNPGRKVIGY